ncbi:molybdenum cofactor guanylyltransferase MobA [Marinobacter sp. SS21]|uniref:molybdenum cofactor guanylyltransferase MobA n=1 Tax=Marinobacter sp. SS21 TaxID=2979460 RepID=UPI00232D938F|nr:molybdenum cofactor guanylyltransferase MobA [Marinobacter sp. SS21]MDC0661314.1 molybdenum cofactor guanylyltransferase [Marinobacter sp. SS21]
MSIAGLMLAGGEAHRMGGLDKGRQLWRGRPMAAWVVDALAAVVPAVVISTGRSEAFYRTLAPQLVADPAEFVGQGPLAGLLAGLRAADAKGLEAVLVCPCDTPAVSAALFQALLAAYQAEPGRPVIACCKGRSHPLHGVYPVALQRALERQLRAGDRRVMGFAKVAAARAVDCDAFAEALVNRNRLENLGD